MLAKTQRPSVMNWLEDYGVWEHLLVIDPSPDVAEKVAEEKRNFGHHYRDSAAIIGKPHITIAAFLATDEMEPTLIRWIQAICNAHPRFPVLLRNFSGFVPQTIYINVQNPEPFKQLGKSLKALDHFIRANECPALQLTTTPHLTIARRLSEDTYFKALPDYLQRPFQQSFVAGELTLIKRAVSTGRCDVVRIFPSCPGNRHFSIKPNKTNIMEKISSPAGYRIYEYLLVLKPPEELWQRIQGIKSEFAEKYKTPVPDFTKPHITLVSFTALGMMEEKIVHRLQVTAMGVAPFKVELRNYGSFPTHSIFINVVSKLPIQNLVKELKEAQRLLRLNNENKPHFMDEPHLSICRKLKPWQYESGWLEFSHRQFTGRFIADGMLLLKREAGAKGAFQIAKRFEFQNLPVATKQGSLFM